MTDTPARWATSAIVATVYLTILECQDVHIMKSPGSLSKRLRKNLWHRMMVSHATAVMSVRQGGVVVSINEPQGDPPSQLQISGCIGTAQAPRTPRDVTRGESTYSVPYTGDDVAEPAHLPAPTGAPEQREEG